MASPTAKPAANLFDAAIIRRAIIDALKKLDPRIQIRNPVMCVVFIGGILTTLLFVQACLGHGE